MQSTSHVSLTSRQKNVIFQVYLSDLARVFHVLLDVVFFYISTPTKQQKQTTQKQKKHTLVFPSSPFTRPLCFYHLRGTITIYTIQLWPWLARWWVTSVDFHGDNFSKGGPTIGFGQFLAGDFWLPSFLSGGMLGGGRLTSHVSNHHLTTKCRMNTIHMSKYPN